MCCIWQYNMETGEKKLSMISQAIVTLKQEKVYGSAS